MSATGADGAIRMTRVLRAPIATVFEALVKPELLQRWMCPTAYTVTKAEADARVGGRFRIEMRKPDGSSHPACGTYTEVSPPNVLAFTWLWDIEGHSMTGIQTRIRIELTEQGRDTHLLMTHFDLPNDTERANHTGGWASVLNNLERVFETGSQP